MPSTDEQALWQPYAGQTLTCESSALHLWAIMLAVPSPRLARMKALLSPSERTRATKFYTRELQTRFIVRRAALRYILSAYLACEPDRIVYEFGSNGKPALPDSSLHFNLSHSRDVALLGIARKPVGLDIEHSVPINDLRLVAKHHFTHDEQADLFSLPPAQRTDAFYRCWTRKEAFIKAHGDGLQLPLDRFAVTLLPSQPARFRRIELPGHDAKKWSLYNVEPPVPDTVAAAATEGYFDHFALWSFSDWFY